LKFTLFNLENFFLLETNLERQPQKSPEKVQWIAKTIDDISPDILMLCEVGGIHSLDLFNAKYLNDSYIPILRPGNSDRGIEIGYLIKKNLPFTFMHLTHKEKNFSRDVSELRIFKDKSLVMITLLVHLKSKWDREGNDPNGFLQRSHEILTLLEIYKKLRTDFPNTPVIIAGDFNGVAKKNMCEREFREIYKQTNLIDILELLNTPDDERVSYIHFSKEGAPERFQLDYIFLPITLEDKIKKEESGIYRFKDFDGTPLGLPLNSFERYALPSDHYPLVFSLDL
jgi:endonuclease/exonuclease/phosphatase family metal-dependent hydrolase